MKLENNINSGIRFSSSSALNLPCCTGVGIDESVKHTGTFSSHTDENYLRALLIMNRSLPDIPNAIISIPLIRNAIEIIIANRTNPKEIGCAITRIDTAILRTPTPIRNALDEPEALLDIPCIIRDIPLTSNAIAPRTTNTAEVNTGNSIRTREKPITSRPIPILMKRDPLEDCGVAIPTAILSIPTTSKIIERIKIIVNIAGPM
jgi:hypothetical protein